MEVSECNGKDQGPIQVYYQTRRKESERQNNYRLLIPLSIFELPVLRAQILI